MKSLAFGLAPLAILAACLAGCARPAPPPADAPAAIVGEPYSAVGTEPGWTLTIADGRIDYAGDYGETRITIPAPTPRTSLNGRRYEARAGGRSLMVAVTHGRCSDGMSDRIYADHVTVIADGKTVKGCGGAIIAPAELDGTHWKIISIGGHAPANPARASLSFTEARISGHGGCNRFSGRYSEREGRLALGPLMSTQMACSGPVMDQERRLMGILSKDVTLRFEDGDRLTLIGADHSEILLKRIH